MDAILRTDGRNIGRNFFRALGEGLIDEEAGLISRANSTAAAIRAAFSSADSASSFAPSSFASASSMYIPDSVLAPAEPHVIVNQNFYGVREEKTAYQAYRAAQRVAWGIV